MYFDMINQSIFKKLKKFSIFPDFPIFKILDQDNKFKLTLQKNEDFIDFPSLGMKDLVLPMIFT